MELPVMEERCWQCTPLVLEADGIVDQCMRVLCCLEERHEAHAVLWCVQTLEWVFHMLDRGNAIPAWELQKRGLLPIEGRQLVTDLVSRAMPGACDAIVEHRAEVHTHAIRKESHGRLPDHV